MTFFDPSRSGSVRFPSASDLEPSVHSALLLLESLSSITLSTDSWIHFHVKTFRSVNANSGIKCITS